MRDDRHVMKNGHFKTLGESLTDALARSWRAKKASRGFDTPAGKFEHGDATKQMMNNVITLFPVQLGSVVHTQHNAAQSSLGKAEMAFDGPAATLTAGQTCVVRPRYGFPCPALAAVELLNGPKAVYIGAPDHGISRRARGSANGRELQPLKGGLSGSAELVLG